MYSFKEEDFVHLHIHSEYSLVDGSISLSKLVQKIKSYGQSAVALTDQSNMFAAIDFYSTCKSNDLKPIIGLEIYHDPICQDSALPYSPHLVLLAKNNNGYKNLLKITSSPYLTGDFKKIPTVSLRDLREFAADLIFISPAQMSEFSYLVEKKDSQGIADFKAFIGEICDKESFYQEISNPCLDGLPKSIVEVAHQAKLMHIPLVATSNTYYLEPKDKEAHCIILGIKNDLTEKKMHRRRRDYDYHLKPFDLIKADFAQYPEALANTQVIADQCDVEIKFGEYVLPPYEFASGENAASGLRRLAKEGLEKRFEKLRPLYGHKLNADVEQDYHKRLVFELDVIEKMGFPGYFLIVQNFINWAKDKNIPVGPGRGSGAGSLVAYALRITDIDPIPYNLVFERFLNPERISMPDFDVDFCQSRRDEVIEYVTNQYGRDCVAQITTFGKMMAKAAIRDVGRVLGLGYKRVDQIAKLIPNDLGMTLTRAIEIEPRINQEAANNSDVKKLLDIALQLEGLTRHTSVHAAGVIISDGPMTQYCPVHTAEGTEGQITQYEMTKAEKVGLIKFDFLGLKTLTVIAKSVEYIHENKDPEFNIEEIKLDAKKVYAMTSAAHTVGIFQLESTGMQKLLKKLKPSSFEDIIATVALFRPGPLGSGMVDDFIERKHGRQQIDYMIESLTPVLKDTYGIILYQEQVQKAAAILANYSLGEADLLRRAMGKKKPEEMAKQKVRFIEGCEQNNIDPKKSAEIFELMAKFAEYGFNKSHSAAYGLISYQTAYLKAFYPEEFMAAIMTCDMDNTEKIVRYTHELKRMGFVLQPPSLNNGFHEFRTQKAKEVSFGFGAIKGLGSNITKQIIEERHANGTYKDLIDLARRLNMAKLGRKNFELLVYAGALDDFGYTRADLIKMLPDLLHFSSKHNIAKSTGQMGLFDTLQDSGDGADDKFSENNTGCELLAKTPDAKPTLYEAIEEKKILGSCITTHPTLLFKADMKCFSHKLIAQCEGSVGEQINLLCLLESIAERRIKSSGKRIVYATISDSSGIVEGLMYQDDIPELLPECNQLVVVACHLKRRFDTKETTYSIKKITPLKDYRESQLHKIRLKLDNIEPQKFQTLKKTLVDNPGNIGVDFDITTADKTTVKIRDITAKIEADDLMIEKINHLVGVENVFYTSINEGNL